MKWAEEQDHIVRSPIAHFKKPRGGKREQIISEAEYQNILGCNPREYWQDLIRFAWNTGARTAETLAIEKGVSAHNIATAWVLSQSFASLALIGPRSPGEIVSTLPGAALTLTEAEVLWLNLESDVR